MSQAAYMRDMFDEPESDLAVGQPEVASFYAHRNVLITGGTGFLGRLLIERILRSCSEVNTLFLLVRKKKGKSPEERCNELFDDLIFDRLKREQPRFAQKVVLIDGDIGEVGLGLSPDQRELLRSTHIVIHSAATVRFNEKLRIAVNVNVRGTREMLSLAKEMKDLKAYVHVSTAYSYCVLNQIEEKFVTPPIDYDKLFQLLDILDDASLDHLTPVLLGKWPNTYTFTKAVAEDTVRRNCQNLPLCIVRPSMVIATSKEPIAGWINNVQTVTGLLVGVAVGLLHITHSDPKFVADVIPADFVINNIIVAAWDSAKANSMTLSHENNATIPKLEEPPIYNVVSSSQNPITWEEIMDFIRELGPPIATMHCVWYPFFITTKHRWLYNIYVFFFHLLPAVIADSLARLTGRKPRLWEAYKKIHEFISVTEYFGWHQWRFSTNNVQGLWERLGPADRNDFDFDIGKLDWRTYTYDYLRGARVYVLKDPMDTVPQACAKYARQKKVHYTMVAVLCSILVWVLWLIFRSVSLW